jgi:hypothetical protein
VLGSRSSCRCCAAQGLRHPAGRRALGRPASPSARRRPRRRSLIPILHLPRKHEPSSLQLGPPSRSSCHSTLTCAFHALDFFERLSTSRGRSCEMEAGARWAVSSFLSSSARTDASHLPPPLSLCLQPLGRRPCHHARHGRQGRAQHHHVQGHRRARLQGSVAKGRPPSPRGRQRVSNLPRCLTLCDGAQCSTTLLSEADLKRTPCSCLLGRPHLVRHRLRVGLPFARGSPRKPVTPFQTHISLPPS